MQPPWLPWIRYESWYGVGTDLPVPRCPLYQGGMTKNVRLSYELSAIQHAIQGAQFLAMLLRDDGMPSPEYAQATPAALAGILILAEERLKLVYRALESDVNPAVLHALHNTEEGAVDDDEGLVLHEWPEKLRPTSGTESSPPSPTAP